MNRGFLLTDVTACFALFATCSINRAAVRTVAGFLAGSGESIVFSGEDELPVSRADPFHFTQIVKLPHDVEYLDLPGKARRMLDHIGDCFLLEGGGS